MTDEPLPEPRVPGALPPRSGDEGSPAPSKGPPAPPPPPVHTERRKREVGWQSRDIIRSVGLVLGIYWAFRLAWIAHPLLLATFLGILFGLAVAAGADRLERVGIRRGIGAPLIVLTFVGALVGFGFSVAPTLREQGGELRRKLPEALERVESWMNERQGGLLGFVFSGLANEAKVDSGAADTVGAPAAPAAGAVPVTATTDSIQDSTAVAGGGDDSAKAGSVVVTQLARQTAAAAAGDTAAPAGDARSDAGEAITLKERLNQQLSGATRYLFPFLSSTITAIAGLLLIIFLSIYIAADPALYRRGIMHLFPFRHRERGGEVLSAIAAVLRKWLVTQLVAMVAIGVVTTVVLLILDVPAAFALGVIAGLLEFVPTIGPIMSAVPAVAMGFLDSPEKALYVTIAYIGIQFIENHLLIPLLMQGGMDLPPALTILSQALMALLFGFLGLMCAVPLLAAGMVAVKMLYVEGVVGEPAFDPDEHPLDESG